MRKKQANDYPLEVAGIDWRNLRKGDTIPANKIEEMWHVLFAETRQRDDRYLCLNVKEWLDKALKSIGKEMVLKQTNDELEVLTDAEAVGYLDGQAEQGLRKHSNNTRRMFTAIDTDNLGQHQRDQLTTNQTKHALISSAAMGAKKQAVSLLKQGAKLPKLKPPEED